MTKKDYEKIAIIFRGEVDTVSNAVDPMDTLRMLSRVGNRLADVLAQNNKSFQRGTFLRACGL